MPTLGTAGANLNFRAPFTVPAGQTLVGYVRDTLNGNDKYSALDIKVVIPPAKLAAVRAALVASSTRYSINYGQSIPISLPWSGPGGKGFRIRWRNNSQTAAQITTLLAAVNTAITT